MNIYDFTVTNDKDEKVSLDQYKGKVLLIVNTATECGFTPQYEQLQALYIKYADKGLEILDFPCNQFGHQAPGTDEEIRSFCSGRYGVSFPMFHKIDVNGEKAIPLYQYLTKEKGFAGFDMNHPLGPVLDKMLREEDPDYPKNPSIKWNFTKFLINRDGTVTARFEPTAPMGAVEAMVKSLL